VYDVVFTVVYILVCVVCVTTVMALYFSPRQLKCCTSTRFNGTLGFHLTLLSMDFTLNIVTGRVAKKYVKCIVKIYLHFHSVTM